MRFFLSILLFFIVITTSLLLVVSADPVTEDVPVVEQTILFIDEEPECLDIPIPFDSFDDETD